MTGLRRHPRVLIALAAAMPVAFGLPSAGAGAAAGDVVIAGRGWGHGVGMAQDGAYWMGVAGAGTEDILRQFY
ncbi:MAG TPA: hypothetical protein VHG90_11745, partial [Acidimicrobiales bacterium]|nr:hypothetical protein [Acidimicrobiales bacterium]